MLNSKFDIKDMRLTNVILGVKIFRTPDGHVLNQSHYVENILEKFNKDDTDIAKKSIKRKSPSIVPSLRK